MNHKTEHKGIDIYEVINTENILSHGEYQVRDNVWHWNKKNNDVPLSGIFKIDNEDSSHHMMGKGSYRICFKNGSICDFTIYNDSQIVCWDIVKGSLTLCRVEDLIRNGRISETDGAYLKFKYDYHTKYYTNQQNS